MRRLARGAVREARPILMAAALLAIAVCCTATSASAASERTGLPDSTERAVVDSVRLDGGVTDVLAYRPGATLTATYRARDDSWQVVARLPGSDRNLLEYSVLDDSLGIRSRWTLPFSSYPTRLDASGAMRVARSSRDVRDAADDLGGLGTLTSSARLQDGRWEVTFSSGRSARVLAVVDDQLRAVVNVYTGVQVDWPMARGDRYAFGEAINTWYVFWPSFVLFALVMIELGGPRRMRWWYVGDVLALLSFGISHEFFNRGMIEWSVPLAFPALLYLFARMAMLFVRGVEPLPESSPPPAGRRRLAWRLPTWMLVMLAVFCGGVRYGIDAWGSSVIDVGYSGVVGAEALLDGRSPYGNPAPDNGNGDTYGPLNYAAYVPAVLALGDHGRADWEQGLPSAHAVSIASDALCVIALVLIGWRFISRRGAALLAAGWMTYPYTGWALCSNVNDLLVAALLLLAFAALPRAWLRGALIGCAAMVKFVPLLALAPIAHAGTMHRRRQAITTLAAAALVIAACLAWVSSYPPGLATFAERTFGFQFDRSSPFSPWGMYDLRWLQRSLQVLLVAALAIAIRLPGHRDFRQVAAGMAASMIGVQLVLQHWFYLYVPWFAGFVLIVLVAARETSTLPPRRAACVEPAGRAQADQPVCSPT